MQGEWIKLDQERLDKPMRVPFRGGEVEVRVSPYDLPEAVRGYWSTPNQVFTVEFRYLAGDEPVVRLEPFEFLTPHVGKNSGRLYRLDIDMDLLRSSVQGRIGMMNGLTNAIKSLGGRTSRLSRQPNYTAAQEAIAETPGLVPA